MSTLNKDSHRRATQKYQSLMTSSNISSCLSQTDGEQEKKDFLSLMLKLDIKISLIKGDKEYYYKIWILRKDRKKKVYIKDYYHAHGRVVPEPTLQDILNIITMIIDVPESYEEYCMENFPKPLKEDHLDALSHANRFKGILDKNEINSIPNFQITDNEVDDDLKDDITVNEAIEYFNENRIKRYRELGFTTIHLRELSEYNYLLDQGENMKRLGKLLKQYGFDYLGEFNSKNFPVLRSNTDSKE